MKATRSARLGPQQRPLTGNRLKSNFLSGIVLVLFLTACVPLNMALARFISYEWFDYEGIRPTDPNGTNGLSNPERGFRMELVGGEITNGAPYYPEGKIMFLPEAVQNELTGDETNDQLWVKGMNFYADEGITTALSYIYLTDYWGTTNLPPNKLNAIETTFNAFRNNGYKVIPLFLYEYMPHPTNGPTKDIILGHLQQLEPILQSNSDIIAVMRAGFVGAYGEWHNSFHELHDDHEALTEIVDKILEVVPDERMICIRVPKYKRWVLGLPDLDNYDLLDEINAYQ